MSERNIFAVCDLDVDYAYHFMEYLSKKKNIPFEIQAFTSVESLVAYVKRVSGICKGASGRAAFDFRKGDEQ